MANPHRGEVAFTAGGLDYTLRFSINALCELEDSLGKPLAQIVAQSTAAGLRITTLRAMLWAGLRDHHPGTTLKAAGELIDALGLAPARELVQRALDRAFPPEEGGDAGPPAATD